MSLLPLQQAGAGQAEEQFRQGHTGRMAGFSLCKISIPKKAREEELQHQLCLHSLGDPG